MEKPELKKVDEIAEALKSKLLFPFRSGKNLGKIKDILDKGIEGVVAAKNLKIQEYREILDATRQRKEDLNDQVKKMKKTHIPAPSTRFANRMRFLFSGKLN